MNVTASRLTKLQDAVHQCTCGTAYQAQLSKDELTTTIGPTAKAILRTAPFADIAECSIFIEEQIVKGIRRKAKPHFHSVEVAKDLCYFNLILDESKCPLGKGARIGLT